MSKKLLTVLLLVCALLSNSFVALAQGKQKATLILFNAKIFTANEKNEFAEAVAVDGEKIVAVGTTKEIRARYRSDKEIDLQGKLVTPGFNDAHIHFIGGGLALMRVDLVGAKTLEEAKRRIAAKVKELPAGSWITGRGWDHTLWGGNFPTRQDLDEVAPNNPVIVQRVDGHVSWANTLALKKANVTKETQAPQGGEISRDETGEATGILKETAQGLVGRVVPQTTQAETVKAIELALAEARRYGITSIQDISSYDATKLYREFLKQGKLTVRVTEFQSFDNSIETLKRQREEFVTFKDNPNWIRLGALKGYVDGTLGSRTAAMLAPYSDDPHNSGIPRRPPEELTKMIVERHWEGYQIALHAIGDKANRIALEGFAEAYKTEAESFQKALDQSRRNNPGLRIEGSPRPATFFRHRIEHAQVVAPSDFIRFKELGVIASMQPSHAISDKRWAGERLGEYRVLGAYSWHTFMSYAVHQPFGTDWPVEPISPYLGLYAAVTRQSIEGDPFGGWIPQEKISMADAIRCYTAESAYATFEEKEKGQIAVGMLADFVVHSKDLFTIEPKEILNTEATMTILGGKVVYERK
jgi:predicted amidohydrolase YtcJ